MHCLIPTRNIVCETNNETHKQYIIQRLYRCSCGIRQYTIVVLFLFILYKGSELYADANSSMQCFGMCSYKTVDHINYAAQSTAAEFLKSGKVVL